MDLLLIIHYSHSSSSFSTIYKLPHHSPTLLPKMIDILISYTFKKKLYIFAVFIDC